MLAFIRKRRVQNRKKKKSQSCYINPFQINLEHAAVPPPPLPYLKGCSRIGNGAEKVMIKRNWRIKITSFSKDKDCKGNQKASV